MDDRLTFKLELPEVRTLPVVPRSHFSNSMEDVIYEPEPIKRRSKPWIDGMWFDPNEDGPPEDMD